MTTDRRPSGPPDPTRRVDRTDRSRSSLPGSLVDFTVLAHRLRGVALGLLGLAFAAVVVDGLLRGLTFSIMLLWAGVYAVALVVVTAVLVAVHALRGAGESERRGERLAGPDVGLRPRRRPPSPPPSR